MTTFPIGYAPIGTFFWEKRQSALVAQLDSVSASDAEGCGFDPRRVHHYAQRPNFVKGSDVVLCIEEKKADEILEISSAFRRLGTFPLPRPREIIRIVQLFSLSY